MNNYIKSVGFILIGLIALLIGFTNPWMPTLDALGHKVLMSVLITMGLWIFKPGNLPFSASGCLMMLLLIAFKVKPADVFSGFTSTAIWTLIPALYFGFVLAKTGLGKRIAYLVMKMFKPSFPSMMIAWVIIGVALSMLTPSITVRVAIIMPVAVSCIEVCRLQGNSRGGALILLTAWAMALLPGTGWLTGSLWGPILQGMYNAVPELNGLITFSTWSQVSLLPMELTSLLLVVLGYLVFRPTEKIAMTQESFQKEYASLGPWTKPEIYTALILSLCFLLFVTSKVHQLPDVVIVLGGLFALAVVGVINTTEISQGINWDLVVFIGVSMGLGTVFAKTGVSQWLTIVLVPLIEPLAANPWLFVFGITSFLFLWRFVDVAILMPTVAILTPVLPTIAKDFGINPLVWSTIFVMAANCFFLRYQNMWALVAESIAGDKGWAPSQLSKYGLIYLVACLVSLAITIPYWISIGMFQ